MSYRDELAASIAKAETLKERNARLSEQNATLRARQPHRFGWLPPASLGVFVGCISVALGNCGASDKPPEEPAPMAETTVANDDWTERSDVQPQPPSAPMSGDAVFYGQYWLARVESTSRAFAEGEECIIQLQEGAFNGAGLVTVHCGSELLHYTTVTPPERAADAGFCRFSEHGDLDCVPHTFSGRGRTGCWINTSGRRALCNGDVELRLRTIMRDPRVRRPPTWARALDLPEGPRLRRELETGRPTGAI